MWLCKNYFGVQVGKSALIRNLSDLKRQGILASIRVHGNYISCRRARWPFIVKFIMNIPCSKAELQLSKNFYKRRSRPQIFENSDNSRPTVFNCHAYHNITPPPSDSCKSIHRLAFDLILYFHKNETTKLRDQIVSSTDTCITIFIKRVFKWYPVTELNTTNLTIRVLPCQHYKNELTFLKKSYMTFIAYVFHRNTPPPPSAQTSVIR